MRTPAQEVVDHVTPQVNRVQDESSSSLDVGELSENIEKFTKLLANKNMAGAGRRMGTVKCFSCCETWHIARYCRSDVQGPYPSQRIGFFQCRTLRDAGEQHAAVKLDMESGCNMDACTGDDRDHGCCCSPFSLFHLSLLILPRDS